LSHGDAHLAARKLRLGLGQARHESPGFVPRTERPKKAPTRHSRRRADRACRAAKAHAARRDHREPFAHARTKIAPEGTRARRVRTAQRAPRAAESEGRSWLDLGGGHGHSVAGRAARFCTRGAPRRPSLAW
jgi:hypothetical protein